MASPLEPFVLIGSMVDDQFGQDPQPSAVRFLNEAAGILQGAVVGADAGILSDIITVIAPWRRIERQYPDGIHAKAHDVVELLDQAFEIANAVIVGVEKGLDVHLVDDGVLVPQGVVEEVDGLDGVRFAAGIHHWPCPLRYGWFEPLIKVPGEFARWRRVDAAARVVATATCHARSSGNRSSDLPPAARRHLSSQTPTVVARRSLPGPRTDPG